MDEDKPNLGIEAMRIMREQNVTFRQAMNVAISEEKFRLAKLAHPSNGKKKEEE